MVPYVNGVREAGELCFVVHDWLANKAFGKTACGAPWAMLPQAAAFPRGRAPLLWLAVTGSVQHSDEPLIFEYRLQILTIPLRCISYVLFVNTYPSDKHYITVFLFLALSLSLSLGGNG